VTDTDRLPTIAGALRTAARRFGTPLYLTDVVGLGASAAELRDAFPDPWLRQYSLKANDLPAIVARLAVHGLGANVVSRGEWSLARRAGLSNGAITLEGVGKTDADLRAVIRAAVDGEPLRWVALESVDESAVLAGLGRRVQMGRAGGPPKVDVLLRLNPDVAPETLAGLAVGSGRSKFGLSEAELARAIEAGGGPDGPLRWRGIHLHVGSQLGAIDAWRDAVRRAIALFALWRGSLPDFNTLDLGGGFPVGPIGAAVPSPERFAREVPGLLAAVPANRRPERLAIEPGRFLVARAGWLVASVLHVRDRAGRLVVIDAGMTELIRPALYGAHHDIAALTSLGHPLDGAGGVAKGVAEGAAEDTAEDTAIERTRVEGPICESTDSLGEHLLPPLRRGDLVAIRNAGAYAASLSSTYNGRPRPPQVLLEPTGASPSRDVVDRPARWPVVRPGRRPARRAVGRPVTRDGRSARPCERHSGAGNGSAPVIGFVADLPLREARGSPPY
jgi:diaminopimelate decarboxylase